MSKPGLYVISSTGAEWRWESTEAYVNRLGKTVPVDVWSRTCRDCGDRFTVQQRCPGYIAQAYKARATRARACQHQPEVVLALRSSCGNFWTARCIPCRRAVQASRLV